MPEIFVKQAPNVVVKVWKIEEEASFFLNKLSLTSIQLEEYYAVKHPSKKLEWLASRLLLQNVVFDKTLVKNANGKPMLLNENEHISLSHCFGYAAVIYSKTKTVGIDIEPINDKVQRIAPRFLSPTELAFIDKEQTTKHLIACWCIKEAIFKMAGVEGVNFDEEISIKPFQLNDEMQAEVTLNKNDKLFQSKIRFYIIDNCILAYTF
jgi:phosphopantetheine--protein transferase-like protein